MQASGHNSHARTVQVNRCSGPLAIFQQVEDLILNPWVVQRPAELVGLILQLSWALTRREQLHDGL
eukprot:10525825-Alexandrium_andersonii.AAC.1